MNVILEPADIKKYNRYVLWVILGSFSIFILLLLCTYLGLFGPLPPFRDLENPKSNLSSEVLTTDNTVLGSYYVQNRSSVTYNQLSPNVVNALISTEDSRFLEHSGIDFRRVLTIPLLNLIGKKQGGSTITQQLAKTFFRVLKNITQSGV